MRLPYLLMAVLAIPTITQAAPNFEGVWFTCFLDTPETAPYDLVEVVRKDNGYIAVSEWGENYAQSGDGILKDGRLIFRGCPTYRGEVSKDCDESNPPVFFRLSKSDLQNKLSSAKALKQEKRIKTTKQEWSSLVKQCAAIRTKPR